MHIRSLVLKDFRIFNNQCFTFGPRINRICGPNARGKTTILEAIYLLMTGRSFRTSQLKDLIREGATSCYVEATFDKHGVEQTLSFGYDGQVKRVLYNQTLCPSISSLLGLLQGTLMIPDDIALIKGAPRLRRRYIDIQLAQIDPLYVHHLTRYHRAMTQRNQLLRTKNLSTIEVWEREMAKDSLYLIQQRYQAIEELHQNSFSLLPEILNAQEDLILEYVSGAPTEGEQICSYYLDLYRKTRYKEMQYGSTLAGPHRDDLRILIGGKPSRYFASEGQQRSCVAALRLAEWSRMQRLTESTPVMLIDDIGVSLDQVRRSHLIEHLKVLEQVFLTTTDESGLGNFSEEKRISL